MSSLVHIRVVVPASLRESTFGCLAANPSVTNIVVFADSVRQPVGDLVLFDVARESINETVESLVSIGVRSHGSITVVHTHLTLGERVAALPPWSTGPPPGGGQTTPPTRRHACWRPSPSSAPPAGC